MPQQIDPVKLKATAEHLEWVCQQCPNDEKVQGLYRGLLPMIEDAKAGRVTEPLETMPFEYVFADGAYTSYDNPSVDSAYYGFAREMKGGLTEQDRQFLAKWEAQAQAETQAEANQSKEKIQANSLKLTPEQQVIFDRVVGIVTQNDKLRQRFKNANDELDKNPEGNELEYIVDSDESDALEFRAASDAIDTAILDVEPSLKTSDRWLFGDIAHAICTNFREQ